MVDEARSPRGIPGPHRYQPRTEHQHRCPQLVQQASAVNSGSTAAPDLSSGLKVNIYIKHDMAIHARESGGRCSTTARDMRR